jgi:ATP-dependent Zn protease
LDAKVKVGEKIYTQRGEFSITALQIELVNTVADHQLLFSLTKKHDGELLYPNQLDELAAKLIARNDIKSVSFSEKKLSDVINLKWIFFLLLLFLSAEWFMRKRNGAY